jgi:hypothetical protein
MPVALLILWVGYRRHHRPLALWLGGLSLLVAYIHVLGGTPEWTLALAVGVSVLAAAADWRAGRRPVVTRPGSLAKDLTGLNREPIR